MRTNPMWFLSAALAAACAVASGARAAEASDHIKDVAQTCMGCHASADLVVGDPGFHVPKIQGQRVKYIIAALNAYRSGERVNAYMTPQAKLLSEADIKEIALYFGGPPWTPPGAPHPPGEQTKTPQMIIDYCGSCHTENGSGTMPEIPMISGQHEDYLAHALNEYRDGGRKNLIMPNYAKKLSDDDVKELAAYFARQTGLKQSGDQ